MLFFEALLNDLVNCNACLGCSDGMCDWIFLFVNKKGSPMHRRAGRCFVLYMLAASITAFWIREINDGQFSLIHLLIPFTIGSIGWAVCSIRRVIK